MKRLLMISLTLLSLATTAGADVGPAASAKKVVAVLPFSSPHAYSLMGRNAQATFVTHLVKTRKLRVIQASMVARMLRRRGLHYTGTVSPELLKAAGRWLKADYLLVGKLRWTGDAYTLSVHAADVRTLETTHAEDVDFQSANRMRVAVRLMAQKIAAALSGTSAASGRAGMFLKVDARAFYDTAAACLRVLRWHLQRNNFTGSIAATNDERKTIRVKGYGFRRLKKGTPLDVFDPTHINGRKKVLTAYVSDVGGDSATARYLMGPEDGVPMAGQVDNRAHQWVVAVGQIVDEAEANKALVTRFRDTLLEKMSEGNGFQQIEGGITDRLAKLSGRRQRFFAYRQLFSQGVELVLDGKFYGAAGSRRAHFKLYSTLTGKVYAELKFETRL